MKTSLFRLSCVVGAAALVSASALAKKPVCGDGVAGRSEACDGADLGGASCADLGFDGGVLACDSGCQFDTSACTYQSCGDNIVGGYEECDGADDGDCPGQCSAHCACPALPGNGDLELHMVDVGQGDAVLIISPDGFAMLVDAGTEGKSSAIGAYMDRIGLSGLDYTLVTHMHADHVGGMDLVLNRYDDVVASFDHGAYYASGEHDEYDAAAGARRDIVSAGDVIDMGPSTQVEVLHGHAGSGNENDNSVVIRVAYGNTAFLLGGDCEQACEASFDPGLIDVYKVHHHGSSTSSGETLLGQMNPGLALISVGTGNSYGHPTQETLDRLASHGAEVHRTDLEGALVAVSDGVSASFVAPPPPPPPPPSSGPVRIAQVHYDTPGTDSLEEFVDLYNPQSTAVSLAGWSLADAAGSWSLPADTVIDAGAYLTVARDALGFQALYGAQPDVEGMSISLNNGGDQLSLSDPSGLVDFVAWEDFAPGWSITAGTGSSIERSDPSLDSDSVSDWVVTSPAVPRGGTAAPPPPPGPTCGDGLCEAGEDCQSCAADCVGKTGGKPSTRYCCGNGVCEEAGEDSAICALDC